MGSGASKDGAGGTTSMAIAQNAKASAAIDNGLGKEMAQKVDSRLPFSNFKELFTLKNYWKTVRRNDAMCSKTMMHKWEFFEEFLMG
jgi:hypothetical protein